MRTDSRRRRSEEPMFSLRDCKQTTVSRDMKDSQKKSDKEEKPRATVITTRIFFHHRGFRQFPKLRCQLGLFAFHALVLIPFFAAQLYNVRLELRHTQRFAHIERREFQRGDRDGRRTGSNFICSFQCGSKFLFCLLERCDEPVGRGGGGGRSWDVSRA